MTTMRASGRAAATVSTPAFRKGSLAPSLAEECVQPRLDSSWQGEQLGFGDGRPSYSTSRRIFEVSVAPPKAHSRIDHYEFGQIVVERTPGDQGSHHPARPGGAELVWRRDGHALVLDDPVEVLDELPPHLVVGTGAHGRMRPDPTTLQQLGPLAALTSRNAGRLVRSRLRWPDTGSRTLTWLPFLVIRPWGRTPADRFPRPRAPRT